MRALPHCQRKLSLTMLTLGLLVLAGCSGTQPRPTEQAPVKSGQTVIDHTYSLPRSQYQALFDEAEQQLLAHNWRGATMTLATLPPEGFTATDAQYYAYLEARIAWERGQHKRAHSQLQALYEGNLDPAIANKVALFYRQVLSLSGGYVDSARIGAELHAAETFPEEKTALAESVWQDLQHASVPALQGAYSNSDDANWQGWLNLALLSAQAGSDPALGNALSRWQVDHPGHPVNGMLPGGLDRLLQPVPQPARVALLLPLSDRLAPAARAVRDGYLAHFYAAHAATILGQQLRIIDTDQYTNVLDAYNDAASWGAQLVIGPLSKNDVTALLQYPARSVPTLALNRVDDAALPDLAPFTQLAIAPEDEAAQIAAIAYGKGLRRAMILRPTGAWGDKMEQALLQRWRALGGETAAIADYTDQDNYSASISSALNLGASQQRARDVRSMLATNIEFTPRRREDVDVVFLLARSGSQARSLKPLLAYHYAGGIPVIATSTIYRGVYDSRDKDLNGVQLVETPWLLGGNRQLHNAVKGIEGASDAYGRLNALGADAYLLQARLQQLSAGQAVLIRGNTGLLGLNDRGQVVRQLQPARFDKGNVVAQ